MSLGHRAACLLVAPPRGGTPSLSSRASMVRFALAGWDRAGYAVAMRAAARHASARPSALARAAVQTGLLAAAMGALPAPAQAAECVEPPPNPANTYDAARTYPKVVRNYPFIRIASDEAPAGVKVVRDLTYSQQGSRCLKLDLYLPQDRQASGANATADGAPASAARPAPMVVLVHGGGWGSGYRTEFAPMAVRLAQRGYAAATVTYRLSGEAHYPAAIHDVRAAVRWVRAHAGLYGFDPQRMVLAGGSAGGQIASLAGVTGHLDQFDPGARTSQVSSAVQAIVNIDGLSDFTTEDARQHEDDPNKKPSAAGAWFGGRYSEKSALWHEGSPTNYVRAGMPPILFIGSSQVRFQVGRDAMVARMTGVGAIARIVVLPDTPHSFWLFDPWLQPTVDAAVAFLGEVLPR